MPNGDMESAIITTEGDTMPSSWGYSARRDSGRVRMGYEMVSPFEGVGAMRLEGEVGHSGTWLSGFNYVLAEEGGTTYFHFLYRLESVGELSIELVRFCGGGGYCELDSAHNVTALLQSGTTDGWQEHSVDIALPSTAECTAACDTLHSPHVTVRLTLTGPGTAWLDCLSVGETRCHLPWNHTVAPSGPGRTRALAGGALYDLQGRPVLPSATRAGAAGISVNVGAGRPTVLRVGR